MSKPVQALPGYLAAPIDATQTSFSIRALKDSRGNLITAMVGTLMHATIEPRSTSNQEIISWTGITNLGGGLITVTGVTRNRNPQPPYAGQTGTVAHAGGVEIILSDTGAMWGEYPNVNEPITINAQWSYGVRPRSNAVDSDPSALVNKAELAAAALAPGALGNLTVSGVAGESVNAQAVVWFDTATGKWKTANGNVLAELQGTELGIALSSEIMDGVFDPGVAIFGRVSGFTGLSLGLVYVDDTGNISNTPGTVSRVIGSAVSSTDIIFDPLLPGTLTVSEKAALAGGGIYGTPSGTNKFVTTDYLNSGPMFFGDGSDGDVTISAPTSLTRDMYYNNLVVSDVLTTNGYRIFVKGTISGAGTIAYPDGGAGGNASGPSYQPNGGAGGNAYTAGGILVNTPGGAGGAGGMAGGGGAGANGGTGLPVAGNNSSAAGSGSGTNGGNGLPGYIGVASSAAGDGGASVNAGAVGAMLSKQKFGLDRATVFTMSEMLNTGSTIASRVRTPAGAPGGGGGQGGNASGTHIGGGGGGGGASGGIIFIAANVWAGTFTIKAIAGNGGNGGNGNNTNGRGGGGGAGGNGGISIVVYGTKSWSGAYNIAPGTGGTAGTGTSGNGTAGSNGAAGVSYELKYSTLL